ncbi:MAG: TSUP family transporter, partial [Tepidisphaerales bacterium]
MLTLSLLFIVALVSGYVDAIAGGGGLLTVPALMLVNLPLTTAFGTNKGQAVFGVASSLYRYARSPLLDRRRAVVSFAAGFAGSVIGTVAVIYLGSRFEPYLRPVVMVLLASVALVMLFQRLPDHVEAGRHRTWALVLLVAASLGFYDGFFGPGTGMFLIMAYAWLWREALDRASANAKVVNCASNLGSMLTFLARGLIVWHYAIPMAAGQLIGGWLGAHTVVTGGRKVVR